MMYKFDIFWELPKIFEYLVIKRLEQKKWQTF